MAVPSQICVSVKENVILGEKQPADCGATRCLQELEMFVDEEEVQRQLDGSMRNFHIVNGFVDRRIHVHHGAPAAGVNIF